MPSVLITDDVSPVLLAGFKEKGWEVEYLPNITREDVLVIIENYEGLIINSKIICDSELLSKAAKLRWIGRLGSGMEVIDTAVCNEKNIFYFNSPDGNAQAVAEHALGLLLSLLRNIPKSNQEVKNREWIREPNRGEELRGKTVGIIGFGHTGSAFAKLLSGFDVKVLAHDKYKTNFGANGVKEATPEAIFEEADVLSLHLPLTLETKHYVNDQFLSQFKKSIYLINTSRGKVVESDTLNKNIMNGVLLGVALDVLENEKFDTYSSTEIALFKSLSKLSNVILTPHIAGWTHQSKVKIAESILRQLAPLL